MKEAIGFLETLSSAEQDLWAAEEQLNEMRSEAAGESFEFGDASVGAFESITRQEIVVQYHRNIVNGLESQISTIYPEVAA